MKKNLLLAAVLVSLLLSTSNVFSLGGSENPSKKIISNDRAARFLKLGNDLRDLGHYDRTLDILTIGQKYASKSGDQYWIATANQYLGLYYRDIEDYNTSLKYLKAALKIFKNVIYNDFDGSQKTTFEYINQVRKLMKDENIEELNDEEQDSPSINGSEQLNDNINIDDNEFDNELVKSANKELSQVKHDVKISDKGQVTSGDKELGQIKTELSELKGALSELFKRIDNMKDLSSNKK
jgi:tetratricopeptide (TPR) repeat protein